MAAAPDFTDAEKWVVETTLRERYGRDIEFQLADADIRIHPAERELTSCPVTLRESDDGCHFVIFRTGETKCRGQFFYKSYKQMGIGTEDYDDLAEGAMTLLQAQADCVAEQRSDLPGRGD